MPNMQLPRRKHMASCLLKCNQHHIHALRVKRHNKAVWELRQLILSSQKSRCYILMNAGTFNNNPQENTIPPWLLPCTCEPQRCHCNARFKPNILCIKGLLYQSTPPLNPENNLTIQFIEFTYCNDRFSLETINNKIQKYQPLINSIIQPSLENRTPHSHYRWRLRNNTHPSMKLLESKLKYRKPLLKTHSKKSTLLLYNMPHQLYCIKDK